MNRIVLIALVAFLSSCLTNKEVIYKNLSEKDVELTKEIGLSDPVFNGIILESAKEAYVEISAGEYNGFCGALGLEDYTTIVINYSKSGNTYTIMIPSVSINDDVVQKVKNGEKVRIEIEEGYEIGILKKDSLKNNISDEIR